MKRSVIFLIAICFGLLSNWILHAQQTTPLVGTESQPEIKRMTSRLTGEVVWKGYDLSHTNVSVYRDEKLKDIYTSGISKLGTGTFSLRVEPGRYYLVAYVDIDGSGKFDEGDGYGVLGVKDWSDEKQKHIPIEVGENTALKGIEIPITARLQSVDDTQKLVPASAYKPSENKLFKTELIRATSGLRGVLKWTGEIAIAQNHKLVLAYTDTSWKYRAGITIVNDKTNEWELRLKPGKYYLMAIVDKNGSNKLDEGDIFGFYGIKDIYAKGAFPEPILVKTSSFAENVEIHLTATYNRKNLIVSSDGASIISGRVFPIPQTQTEVRIEVYDNSAFVKPIATTVTNPDGTYRLQLPPGEYYIIANHDVDGDGRYSKGDMLGGLGTESITEKQPAAVVFDAGETNDINIQLSAKYDAEGQLVAINDPNITPSVVDLGANPTPGVPQEVQMGSITGKVTSFFAARNDKRKNNNTSSEEEIPAPHGILSLSTTPDFTSPLMVPLILDEEGNYLVDVKPGRYFILAVLDQNRDGASGLSDGIGVYGTHHPVRGTPAPVTVLEGKTTPHVDIDIMASYVDEAGTMSEIEDGGRWNIARMHGEPEDIFKYTQQGKQIEEWMYWTKGLGFKFVAEGAGWELKDQNQFEPNTQNINKETETPDEEQQTEGNESNTVVPDNVDLGRFSMTTASVSIYYSHDGILWRIAPTTADDIKLNALREVPVDSRMAPLDAGYRPSASVNGTLVYHDFDNNVIIRDIKTGKSSVYFDGRALAEDVVISPDGEYIAYSRNEPNNRKRIVIQNIRNEDIFLIPSTAREMTNPAWSIDGQFIAYATAGSIENPAADTNRNIYLYNQGSNSVEPIVISPADDAEPSWHPTDRNTLVFSRGTDESIRQIWVVNYSSAGERTEQQITEMGGSRPVWVPPNGRWIIYENNGQLWTVDYQNPGSESPLLSNGKVVFGYQPVAVSFE